MEGDFPHTTATHRCTPQFIEEAKLNAQNYADVFSDCPVTRAMSHGRSEAGSPDLGEMKGPEVCVSLSDCPLGV